MPCVWKPIDGYPDYEVSNTGKVRNCITGKELKTRLSNKGYDRVRLYKNRIGKNLFVHRLVAKAFIPNPDNLPLINHKDETPLNNCVDNLEWCDYAYNNSYGNAVEKRSTSNSKKVVQMTMDGDLVHVFDSIKEAAFFTKAQPSHISRCCNHLRNKAGGYRWCFYEKGGEQIAL